MILRPKCVLVALTVLSFSSSSLLAFKTLNGLLQAAEAENMQVVEDIKMFCKDLLDTNDGIQECLFEATRRGELEIVRFLVAEPILRVLKGEPLRFAQAIALMTIGNPHRRWILEAIEKARAPECEIETIDVARVFLQERRRSREPHGDPMLLSRDEVLSALKYEIEHFQTEPGQMRWFLFQGAHRGELDVVQCVSQDKQLEPDLWLAFDIACKAEQAEVINFFMEQNLLQPDVIARVINSNCKDMRRSGTAARLPRTWQVSTYARPALVAALVASVTCYMVLGSSDK